MRALLRRAKNVAEQWRIQAVLMRASDALPPVKIAELTGLSVHSVRVLHSRFLREGEACLIGRPGRGGRRRTLLTAYQTKTLLDQHAPAAAQGGIVVANVFKRDYERLVGPKVALSSVYRLLEKAGLAQTRAQAQSPQEGSGGGGCFFKNFAAEVAAERVRRGRTPLVVFMDEGRFGRISNLTDCWASALVRPRVPRQVVRESLYAFAAVALERRELVHRLSPKCNTAAMSLFLLFLLDLLGAWPDKPSCSCSMARSRTRLGLNWCRSDFASGTCLRIARNAIRANTSSGTKLAKRALPISFLPPLPMLKFGYLLKMRYFQAVMKRFLRVNLLIHR
jgi:transposase